MTSLYWLDPEDNNSPFPPVELALDEPDGLLAVGGNLAPERLLNAYRHGIFPWYAEGQPILWWSPDPRAVLFPEQLRISRSLRKTLRRAPYGITFDTAFAEVIRACAEPRPDQPGTWITEAMIDAYVAFHHQGHAHSVECWSDNRLVGGLYGVAIGRVFFGESMFTRETDASKVAFVYLVRQLQQWGYPLIDCQVDSAHLQRLGARTIPRSEFVGLLERFCAQPGHPSPWRPDADVLQEIA